MEEKKNKKQNQFSCIEEVKRTKHTQNAYYVRRK